MKLQKVVFLLVLLVVSFFFSAVVCFLLKYQLFNINNFGFQFAMYSIVGSFIYFTLRYLKLLDTLVVAFLMGFIFAFILMRTSLMNEFGSLIPMALYTSTLYIVFMFIFKAMWLNKRGHLRSLTFSIVSAIGYTAVHLAVHGLIKKPIQSNFITTYFMNGLMIMITLSLAFNLADFIMQKLDETFFVGVQEKQPEKED